MAHHTLRTTHAQELKLLTRVLEARAQQNDIDLNKTALGSLPWEPGKRARVARVALSLAIAAQSSDGAELSVLCEVLQYLLRRDLGMNPDTISELMNFLERFPTLDLKVLPLLGVVQAIEKTTLSQPLPSEWQRQLRSFVEKIQQSSTPRKGTAAALSSRIKKLCEASPLSRFTPDEGWADRLRAEIASLAEPERRSWETVLQQAAIVFPQLPAKSWDVPWEDGEDYSDLAVRRRYTERVLNRGCASVWRDQMRKVVESVGAQEFQRRVTGWLHAVPGSKPGYLARESLNREALRGLLWSLEDNPTSTTIAAMGVAADYFFKKNSPLALDSVRILYRIGTPESLHQLTVLAGRIKAANQKEILQVARELVAARNQTSIDDLIDLNIPTSGFTELGRRRANMEGITAEIVIERMSAKFRWFKSNGQPQASIPAAIKRNHTTDLEELKHSVKEVEITLTTLAKRFEDAPLAQCSWTMADWKTRFLKHPVVGTLVRRIIWELSDGEQRKTAVWFEEQLQDVTGKPVMTTKLTRIAVWHPLGASLQDVVHWQNWLTEHQITQPFKQAHREVYLLTDAERATATYSNRFAGNILRQSQFRALAKSRGWKADYLGGWDGGGAGQTTMDLPRWRLRAELWCGAAGCDQAQPHGYLATDQVRFYHIDRTEAPLPLADVPGFVFSEILRDVDLFVGVASIGNDPAWQDGGQEGRYRDYWHDFSFGDLSASAATRKQVLERLVPRLKIAARCSFTERFLFVRGELRNYKIHLGSGNILMEPNDQYLCIVPDAKARISASDLYLPFEGDTVLSIIISKALLLAEDAKVEDPTISRQIQPT